MSPALIIDTVMPEFQAGQTDVCVVEAPPSDVYQAVRDLDFLSVHSPLVDAALFVRTLPERLTARRSGESAAPPPRMALADMFDRPDGEGGLEGWMPLGEDRGHEIVFGAVGTVWQPTITWRTMSPDEFADFAEPGYAKIAAAFTVVPLGQGRSVLAYEARTCGTDDAATRRFRRYWRLVRPFVGVIMRAALRTVKRTAEAGH